MIGILDYGLGNVSAFENCFRRFNQNLLRVTSPGTQGIKALIIPGVGHFDDAARRLDPKLRCDLTAFVASGGWLLGVCIGMQLLMDDSEEGELRGLGFISGSVRQMAKPEFDCLPHLGWNSVVSLPKERAFAGSSGREFYFMHSYICCPSDDRNVKALANNGKDFAAIIQSGRVVGMQFHPEKSHGAGLSILQNFYSMVVES